MIESIEGIIATKKEDKILLKLSGITFGVFMTTRDINRLSINDKCLIHTYLRVKDDGWELYGFITEEEKRSFKILIGINSVGPKTAIAILDKFSYDELLVVTNSEDIEKLSKVPGIGKKTAGRIILELSGKLAGTATVQGVINSNYLQAKEGLSGMGYDKEVLDKKLSEMETNFPDLTPEEIIKRFIKNG